MIKTTDTQKLEWERMPSREFRKRYPRLTKPVVVTSMGRPIGLWQPVEVVIRKEDGARE